MKLHPVSRFLIRNSTAIALVGTILGLVGVYFSVLLYKNLRTDIEELLPQSARSGRDLNVLTSRMESIDSMGILIFTGDSQAGRRYVDALVPRLERIPKTIAASVEYRVAKEMAFFKKRAALFLDLGDLAKVRDYIRDRIKFEKEMYSPLNIFPVTERLKEPKLDFDELRTKYGGTTAYDSMPDGYYATPDGKKRIILVYMAGKHSDIHHAHELRAEVDKAVAELNPKDFAPDLEVHYTGGVENFLEEHAALIADLEVSTIIVVVLVGLFMLLFYRDVFATASLLVSLFMGTLWTFAVSYFAVGYLNANSAFLGSIVIGNGINFGIIMLARYVEERGRGGHTFRALDTAVRTTATATLTAALAAGLSYGSLILTQFRGFRQFGVIGLIGMVLCWLSAFTLLPAYLVKLDRRRLKPGGWKEPAFGIGALVRLVERHPKAVCAFSLLITLASLATLPRLGHSIIESDLNKLRNKDSMRHGSGYYDQFMNEIFKKYLTPIVLLTSSREEANAIAGRLRQVKKAQGRESMIATVQAFDDFVPGEQPKKIALLKEIRRELTPEIVDDLPDKEKKWVADFLTPQAFQPFAEKDIPPLIVSKFTEKDGSVGKMVYVEPPVSQLTWEGGHLIAFIHTLRDAADSIAPGTPVAGQLPISSDLIESISHDGPRATSFAFLAVIVLVVLLFRNVSTIALCLFSLILGVLWLAGCILGFDLKINFLNFIALPITFGIGVDYGVNVFQRYRQEGSRHILSALRQTGGAVLLASITTIIGYGSLVIAANQAFVSFGRLAILGEFTCLFAAIVALPAYLRLRDNGSTAE